MQELCRQAPSRLRRRPVHNSPDAGVRAGQDMPTDLLAGLLMEQVRQPSAARSERLPLKVYGIMAMTTALTFATLTTGYQMLFTHQLFA